MVIYKTKQSCQSDHLEAQDGSKKAAQMAAFQLLS
jgi:hypothetical protein